MEYLSPDSLGGSKISYLRKSILISFWIVQYCFYYPFTLYYCDIFYPLDAGFFSIPLGCNSLDPDQAQPVVVTDLDPNCLQRLSADNKSRP